MPIHLEDPAPGAACDPLCFRIAGRIEGGGDDIARLEFWLEGSRIGSSSLLWRNDPPGVPRFEHFASTPEAAGRTARLEVRAARRAGGSSLEASCDLRFIARDYRQNHYGVLLDQATQAVYHRENIYGSGPSQRGGSEEVLSLLRRHLGPPPLRVLDVGCGLGWYGENLLREGHAWRGAEMKAEDCADLESRGLPHSRVDGRTLPFPDRSFDAAMAVEVLEHTPDPRAFLAEIRRVAPRRLLISVPNAELIPYLQDYLAVPWHLLEADHKNFFTRWNLGSLLREFYPSVEVMCYHHHPLPAREGPPLYYHLFAVAWNPDPA